MRFRYNALFATILALSSFGSFASEMNAGVIHFTGDIIDPSCEISGDPGHDITVPLGTYPTSLFANVGDESTLTPFSIVLTSCPVASDGLPQVQLTFNGTTTESGSTDLLDLKAGGATKLAIAISLKDDDDTLLKLDGTEDQVKIDLPTLSTDSIHADFNARYRAYAVPVTKGSAAADLTVNILYK